MKSKLNLRNFRHKAVQMRLDEMLQPYLKEKIEEYELADDNERDRIDERVYDFLFLVFGTDKSAVPYSKYLTIYDDMKRGVN